MGRLPRDPKSDARANDEGEKRVPLCSTPLLVRDGYGENVKRPSFEISLCTRHQFEMGPNETLTTPPHSSLDDERSMVSCQ